jgi:hypothetical protein
MVAVATVRAAERLSMARLGIDRSTGRAGLRAVRSGDFDQTTAAPGELVAQELDQAAPASVGDPTRQRTILQHVDSLKALDDDRAVALGVGGGERVEDVVTLAANLPMQSIHATHGLLAVIGSFLSPGDHALKSAQPLERRLQGLGVFDESPVGIGDQVGNAAVESDHGLGTRRRIRKLELAHDRDEPLVAIATNRAALGFTLERPMHDRAHVPQFGETERSSYESSYSRMRLDEPEGVSALAFPAWSPSDALEAALPGLIELDQELRADIAWYVGEKRKLGAQRLELVNLVESVRIEPNGTPEPELSLLERKVPQKAERGLPAQQALLLLSAWVNPKLEPLVTPHKKKQTLVCEKNQAKNEQPLRAIAWRPVAERRCNILRLFAEAGRPGFLSGLKDGVSAQGAN